VGLAGAAGIVSFPKFQCTDGNLRSTQPKDSGRGGLRAIYLNLKWSILYRRTLVSRVASSSQMCCAVRSHDDAIHYLSQQDNVS
jgi:hypothetical protein